MNPTSGEIWVDGKSKALCFSGYGNNLENPGFIGSLSGYKNLRLLADIHKK